MQKFNIKVKRTQYCRTVIEATNIHSAEKMAIKIARNWDEDSWGELDISVAKIEVIEPEPDKAAQLLGRKRSPKN